MNKRFLSVAVALGLVVSNVSLISADEVSSNIELPKLEVSSEEKISGAKIVSDKESVNYSDFLKDGGGWQWVNLELQGAKITTQDPYELSDAITQNYDVVTTLALPSHGESFEFGVFEPNSTIEYIDTWEITIDASVLDINEDLTIKIPVVNDIGATETPKIIASRDSITKEELRNGFDLTLETTNGATFNTSCFAYEPRVSIIRTANVDLEVLPYCNQISPNKITFFIKALNDIPYYRDTLEFRIEGNATNSKVPMMVKLDLVSEVNQSDLDKLKEMIKNAPNVTLDEYTKESYAKFQSAIRQAYNVAYSNSPDQGNVKEMIALLGNAIDNLEKIENLDEVVQIEDESLKRAIQNALGMKSEEITVGDMKNIKSLNFEDDMYLRSLSGLEYATNLETLNINYNEVTDLSPLKNLVNLKEVTGLENYVMNPGSVSVSETGNFELENKVIDVDGKKMVPTKIVLSPNTNPVELNVNDHLVDGKIVIDEEIAKGHKSLEVYYESGYNNYSLYSFYFLNN